MASENVKKYIKTIDEKYRECKLAKLSRFSAEWGIWSREMNIEIDGKIKAGHPDGDLLKYVKVYWINTSQLLEAHYKFYTFSKMALKKKIAREGEKIKRLILAGRVPNLNEKDIGKMILKNL